MTALLLSALGTIIFLLAFTEKSWFTRVLGPLVVIYCIFTTLLDILTKVLAS